MSKLVVAEEILRQLGGNKFIAMTGAKNFITNEWFLGFKIGKNNAKINYIRITLNGKDLYDIEFCYIRAGKITIIEEFNDVYCDQLVKLFKETTGMYTSL